MTEEQRVQLMKLVAAHYGKIDDWHEYKGTYYEVRIPEMGDGYMGQVVYDQEDKEITINGHPLGDERLKILDQYLLAKAKKLVISLLKTIWYLTEKMNDKRPTPQSPYSTNRVRLFDAITER